MTAIQRIIHSKAAISLIAGFRQCFIDFELSSLFRWALVFKSIRLDRSRANVVIDGEGILNLARLGSENSETEPPGKSSRAKLTLEVLQTHQ